MILRLTVSIVLLLFLVACSTKVLKPELEDQTTALPQLTDYHDRWFLGFVRNSYTNPVEACVSETPVKVRDYFSLEDFLLTLMSFGIYTPATTQVWCVSDADKTVSN